VHKRTPFRIFGHHDTLNPHPQHHTGAFSTNKKALHIEARPKAIVK
jgi:hypothetical protein